MKTVYLKLLVVGIISIFSVLLVLANYYHKRARTVYDFTRNIPYKFQGVDRYDLKFNTFYIVGSSKKDIYLGNYTTSNYLVKIDLLLRDTQSFFINVDSIDFHSKGQYKILIDSSLFFLVNGIGRSILTGQVGKWNAKPSDIFVPYFLQAVPLGKNSLFFRYVNAKSKENSLIKESVGVARIENEELLEKQIDGLFCTEGILQYNRHLNKLIYVYHYRNQILVIDTNLNLVKKIKTIDPIDTAKFTVSSITSDNSKVVTSPALVVNANCESWGKYLLIQSKIMGKNDDEELFKNSTVIDIYDLEKSTYVYSFYLPNQSNHSTKQFKVINDYVYTISDTFISRYKITLPKL